MRVLPVRPPADANSNATSAIGTLSVLIVDDDARVRRHFKALLAAAIPGMQFGEAGDVPEMMKQLAERVWSAVLLDIVMPGRSGLEALPDVKANYPHMPVLVVSMQHEEHYAERVLSAGAANYLMKEFAPNRLIAAIRALLWPHERSARE